MMKRSIAIIMVVIIGASGMTGCGKSKEELKAELQEAQKEKQELEATLTEVNEQIQQLEVENAQLKQSTGDSADQYLSAKFYQDWNYYVSDTEFEFYSDKNCENRIENNDVRIILPTIDNPEWKNGLKVYTVLSEQGYIYSVDCPD